MRLLNATQLAAAYRKGEVVGRSWRCGDGLLEPAAVRWVAAVEGEMKAPFGRGQAVTGAEDQAGVAAVAGGEAGPAGEGKSAEEVLRGAEGRDFEGAVDDRQRGHGLREDDDQGEVTHSGAGFGMSWSALQRAWLPNFGEAFQ